MKISELAEHTGLATSAIRFYESKDLIQATRRPNGYRDYPPQALTVLKLVAGAQRAGFSLDDISRLVPPDLTQWNHAKLMSALSQKLADLDAMVARLQASRRDLQELLDMIAAKPEGMDCDDNARRVTQALLQRQGGFTGG